MNRIKKMIIVGGGTAGLVAAIIHKRLNPTIEIQVLESSEIGIIGVGEGSTEHWNMFIDQCNLSRAEVMKECAATIKTGIKFVNWNGKGDDDVYFHSVIGPYDSVFINGVFSYWTNALVTGKSSIEMTSPRIPVSMFQKGDGPGTNQYHFDTFKLNQYLHKVAKERGVTFTDAIVNEVKLKENGYVKSLVDNAGNEYTADFFVDASGFNRVIMNKLGAKWIDCKKYLPMNHAIAFPTEYQEDIDAFTTAHARNAGWSWRIPTQERFGNGYVFCDDYITKEQAHAEMEQIFGRSIEIGRDIKFGAGHVDRPMINNCTAIGLAGVFVEPLEASSIGATIQQCFALSTSLQIYEEGNKTLENIHNKQMLKMFSNIIDYIQIHYFTKRDDTAFWKDKPFEITEFNKETIDTMKRSLPSIHYFQDPYLMFRHVNWFMTMEGLKLFDIEEIKRIHSEQPPQAWEEVNTFFDNATIAFREGAKNKHRDQLQDIMSGMYN
jgi:hypothetical protein